MIREKHLSKNKSLLKCNGLCLTFFTAMSRYTQLAVREKCSVLLLYEIKYIFN